MPVPYLKARSAGAAGFRDGRGRAQGDEAQDAAGQEGQADDALLE